MDNKTSEGDLSTRVALLELEQKHSIEYFERLDKTLAKLTEVSSNLSKILAVQEQRISEEEKNSDIIKENIRQLNIKIDSIIENKSDKGKVEDLNKTVDKIKKFMYISWGSVTIVAFFLANFGKAIMEYFLGMK